LPARWLSSQFCSYRSSASPFRLLDIFWLVYHFMIHISAARGQVAQVLTGVLDFLFRPLRSMLSSPPASLFPARHPPRVLPDILTWPDPADLRCRKSFPNARATTPARADPESLRVRRS